MSYCDKHHANRLFTVRSESHKIDPSRPYKYIIFAELLLFYFTIISDMQ